jgi:hypothetical protein
MRKLLQAWLNDEFEQCVLSDKMSGDVIEHGIVVASDNECGYDQLQMPETVWDGLEE